MLVSEFMIPSSKVITVTSTTPLQSALDRMVENKVGCVVVLDSAKSITSPESARAHPVGIVSKVSRRSSGDVLEFLFLQCKATCYAGSSVLVVAPYKVAR